ncbi:hypothetical protein BO70DRAFT_223546 [Aspergillus heteromorphus CBS 117.55]|uniref:Uncharacterized protein n=1 Tax=Aspergillus heteromorphus CBS 117.55 TaxID=1448321 RepID=A0A317WME8_9EURO|nr:uncharacterized protein BO70DRAFT_223546 [Aspergillus heteromorphus CBS 117.55]PWY86227.1 hypothetical protein BO70DRAFT_223546 [Aspergillus heteromorphus CBS 117.55]
MRLDYQARYLLSCRVQSMDRTRHLVAGLFRPNAVINDISPLGFLQMVSESGGREEEGWIGMCSILQEWEWEWILLLLLLLLLLVMMMMVVVVSHWYHWRVD